MFHLDSNTLIFVLRKNDRQRSARIVSRIVSTGAGHIEVSDVVRGELLTGALKSSHPNRKLKDVDTILAPFRGAAFGHQESGHYADIRAHLESEGIMIGPNDLFIAATARAANATLITNNTREFSRVPGLRVEDWSAA